MPVYELIPADQRYYVTIDIDGFDPSIAPERARHRMDFSIMRLELLDGLTKQGNVIGVDLVEVAPDYDQAAAQPRLLRRCF